MQKQYRKQGFIKDTFVFSQILKEYQFYKLIFLSRKGRQKQSKRSVRFSEVMFY